MLRDEAVLGPRLARRAERQSQLSLALALLMFASYVVLARLDADLRYARYVLPVALAVLWLARRAQLRRLALFTPPLSSMALITAAMCVWSALVIGTTSTFYVRFFEESLFLVAPLGAAMVCTSLRQDDHLWPFHALLAIMAVDYAWEIGPATALDAMGSPQAFVSELLFHSNAETESVRAFSFGVLAIFYVGCRRLGLGAVCLLLALLAGKRIALAGLGLALPLALIGPSFDLRNRRVAITIGAVAINLIFAMSLRNLVEWGIADRIQEFTRQSADEFMMGRVTLFELVADRLPDSPVIGVGLGRISDVLQSEGAWLTNAHSDLLKHYIELGPIVFACWIGAFFWLARHRGSFALAVYMNVLFISDNVAIYFDVMFPMYLALAHLEGRAAQQAEVRAARRRPLYSDPVEMAA